MVRPLSRSCVLLLCVLALLSCDQATETLNPLPAITSLTPRQVTLRGDDQTLTVAGSDFFEGSTVTVDGAELPTEFISTTELRITLPAEYTVSERELQIRVVNPQPGGGSSGAVPLPVRMVHPLVTLLSPDFVLVGADSLVLTITGRYFIETTQDQPGTQVLVDSAVIPVTYHSSEEILISIPAGGLDAAGTLTLTVYNPIPGEPPAGIPFEVRNPAPVIDHLSHDQALAGEAFELRAYGSGFMSSSAILLDGVPVPTVFSSPTMVSTPVDSTDLEAGRSVQVSVRTPGPGGGTTAAGILQMLTSAPELDPLPSEATIAGTPGLSLMVHGHSFKEGSVVLWNGVERPTERLSENRLRASIPAADLLTLGVAQISVQGPGPYAGTTITRPFQVRTRPAMIVSEVIHVPIAANDLVLSQKDGRLYAVVDGDTGDYAHSLVAIDPATGVIVDSTRMGGSPNRLAISHHGDVLYVGVNHSSGNATVHRVGVDPWTVGDGWEVEPAATAEMTVLPGMDETVLVTAWGSPIRAYDRGEIRPDGDYSYYVQRLIAGEDAYEFYGLSRYEGVIAYGLEGRGPRFLRKHSVTGTNYLEEIVASRGRVYVSNGAVVDVRLGQVGTAPAEGALMVDPALGRGYYRWDGGIKVVDLMTLDEIGTVSVPGLSYGSWHDGSLRLVRCGPDAIAFLDDDEVIIVRSNAFAY